MNRSVLEGRFLVNMLGAVIRQDDSYPMQRGMDWERLFRVADYNDIASAIYLSMMGTSQRVPQKWGERFFGRYQASVQYGQIYENAEKEILMVLNMEKLPAIVLESSAIRRLYPIPETAANSPLRLYFQSEEDYRRAKGYLIDMDYVTKQFFDGFGDHMQKGKGFEIEIYYKLPFLTKGYQKNMAALLDRAYPDKRYEYLRTLSLESSFVFRMAEACYLYCADALKIRSLLDIYLFYKMFQEKMNPRFLEARFREFAVDELQEGLLQITDMWFGIRGKNLFNKPGDRADLYDELEARILSRGKEGTDSLPEVQSLRKQIHDELHKEEIAEQKRQKKRKKKEFLYSIYKKIRWVFPEYKYMASIYPALEKMPFLLPFFWLLRGLNMLRIEIKLLFQGNQKKEEAPQEAPAEASQESARPYSGRRDRRKVAYRSSGKPSVEVVGAHGASKVLSGSDFAKAEAEAAAKLRGSGGQRPARRPAAARPGDVFAGLLDEEAVAGLGADAQGMQENEEKAQGMPQDAGGSSGGDAASGLGLAGLGLGTAGASYESRGSAAPGGLSSGTSGDTPGFGSGRRSGIGDSSGQGDAEGGTAQDNGEGEETLWEFPRLATVRYTVRESTQDRGSAEDDNAGNAAPDMADRGRSRRRPASAASPVGAEREAAKNESREGGNPSGIGDAADLPDPAADAGSGAANASNPSYGGPVFPYISASEAERANRRPRPLSAGGSSASVARRSSRIIRNEDADTEIGMLNGKEVSVSKWKFPTIEEVEEEERISAGSPQS